MSTLKTTLKVESSSLFPTPISFSAVNDNAVNATSNFGRLVANQNEVTPLSISELGAKGGFLYIQSPSSNPKESAIEIIGHGGELLAKLYSGDTGFIPVSSEVKDISAITTYGTATLDYFIGSRGDELGKSVLIYRIDGDTNWRYFVMDAGTGKPTELKDTGYAIEDWDFLYDSPVTDKGYVCYMENRGNGEQQWFLLDKLGNIVHHDMPPRNVNNWWRLDGKGLLNTYEAIQGATVTLFDGDNLYTHELTDAATIPYLDNGDDYTAADGSFVLYYNTGTIAFEKSVLINKDKSYILSNINYDIAGEYVENVTYAYGNTHIQYHYNDAGPYVGTYTKIRIFDTNGTLIKSVDLTSLHITSRNYWSYGNGKFFTMLWDNDTPGSTFYMMQYNQSTGKLIGENFDWSQSRQGDLIGIDWSINAYHYDVWDETDMNEQSLLIHFYNYSDDYWGWNWYEASYLNTFAIVNNETTYRNVNLKPLYSGTINFDPYRAIVSDKSVSFHYSNSLHAGPGYMYFFLPNGVTNTLTVIPELSTAYQGVDVYLGLNHLKVSYYDNDEITSYHKMISLIDGTVKDTLTLVSNNWNDDWYGDSFFMADYANGKSYWFNVTTGKWAQNTRFYAYSDGVYRGTNSTGLNPGIMGLFEIHGYMKILNQGVSISEKQIFINQETRSYGGTWLLSDSVVIIYNTLTNPNWQIEVYDYNLNLLYTVDTKNDSYNDNWVDNRLILWTWDSLNQKTVSYWVPNKLLCTKKITYVDNSIFSSDHRQINNWDWADI